MIFNRKTGQKRYKKERMEDFFDYYKKMRKRWRAWLKETRKKNI